MRFYAIVRKHGKLKGTAELRKRQPGVDKPLSYQSVDLRHWLNLPRILSFCAWKSRVRCYHSGLTSQYCKRAAWLLCPNSDPLPFSSSLFCISWRKFRNLNFSKKDIGRWVVALDRKRSGLGPETFARIFVRLAWIGPIADLHAIHPSGHVSPMHDQKSL